SGGEKILVALAAALVHHPSMLVLDECDSHLDEDRAREMVRFLMKSGIPHVIRCTQQMESVLCSDRVIFLENGRVVYHGSPQEVFASLSDTDFYPLSLRCRI
ncbi:MAG: ABC transporter, partial [Methanoregula sp.]|nr:ABC transporter [Methanoregula sp.]